MAIGPAILEAMRVLPPAPLARDPAPTARAQPRPWLALNAVGRGQLIDLVV